MYRNPQSLLPVLYYNKLPKTCNHNVAIVLDPMIASGLLSSVLPYSHPLRIPLIYDLMCSVASTIIATVAILKTWGVGTIKVISTIASKQGAVGPLLAILEILSDD